MNAACGQGVFIFSHWDVKMFSVFSLQFINCIFLENIGKSTPPTARPFWPRSVLGQVGQMRIINMWAAFGSQQIASADRGPAGPRHCQIFSTSGL